MTQLHAAPPIKRKLIFIIMMISSAVLLLTCLVFTAHEIYAVRADMVKENIVLGDVIAADNTAALTFSNTRDAVDSLENLRAEPYMVAARIYDQKGARFATYTRAGVDAHIIPSMVSMVKSGFHDGALYVVRPVHFGDETIGSVLLIHDLGELNDSLLRYAIIAPTVLLVALALAFLLASRLQRVISRPILALAQRARSIQQNSEYFLGELPRGYQEIELLIESFDAMLASIAQRDNELKDHTEHMEFEVSTRTSELRTAVEQLERSKDVAEAANRAKSEFLANMSHEIRTPMNGILGMTELTLDTELAPAQREYLTVAKASAEGLLCIINDILDFSKIEAGKLRLDPRPFNLQSLIAETMKAVSLRAHQKGLELAFELEPDVPEDIVGDDGRLRQILFNLVGNAIKFTKEGEIVLSVRKTEQDGALLQFSVRDTGVGIAPDKLSKIFAAFEQEDTSTTRQFGGTGLGLTISARLVEMMGGRIWVESDSGKGSTFHFNARFEISPAPVEHTVDMAVETLRGMRALVVDDNYTNRRILHEMLLRWKMCPELAESGVDAITMLHRAAREKRPYPLVIVDRHMPEMDGFMLLERVHADPDLESTAIMMLTSGDQPEDSRRCQELGVAEYAIKPVSQPELLKLILRALGKMAKEEKSVTPRTLPATLPLAATAPLRILLAEDNVFNQKVALGLLGRMGHNVTVANNGLEAVELYSKNHYDLVLMDVQMPEMDGFRATEIIRQEQEKSGIGIPIIAMTAHAMQGDREKCLAAGMHDYISKPIGRKELTELIERNCARAATERLAANTHAAIPHSANPESDASDGPAAPDPEVKQLENNGKPQSSFGHQEELLIEQELPIEPEKMLAHCGGDQKMAFTLAQMFPAESAKILQKLERARAEKNLDEIELSAHALGGMCGMFEALEAGKAAREVERAAGAGKLPTAEQLENLKAVVTRTANALGTLVIHQSANQ
jgi:two-component system, sensor histidine kinase and response regulator